MPAATTSILLAFTCLVVLAASHRAETATPGRGASPKPGDARVAEAVPLASDAGEVAQQQQVKAIMVQVILQRLDLQEAVRALNTSGIQPPSGAGSWSTVELLDLVIPDEVKDPATFAKIVVENFRFQSGTPIVFELGDSRCTVIAGNNPPGEARYHVLRCELKQK